MSESLLKTTRRSLIKPKHSKWAQRSLLNNSSFHNVSATVIQDMLDSGLSINEHSILDPEAESCNFNTLVDLLFPQFLEILQSHSHNEAEVFETVDDLISCCKDVLTELQKDLGRGVAITLSSKQRQKSIEWLQSEINTWKLLQVLYRDRVQVQGETRNEEMSELPVLGGSEKQVIIQLYDINSTLREYQLIVDWLEATYERPEGAQLPQSSDRIVSWENTLFQLENQNAVSFGKNTEIVQQLDPDAPIRENRALHTLDEEDTMRLSRCIFAEIRLGHVEEAQSLCKYAGQTWRAALLEGWRLHEDPNYDIQLNGTEKIPIEGNPRRDLWKKCAWMMADSIKYDEYTRAIAGSLCGHLDSMKSLLGNSWLDLLWAYLKVQIDIRVESEIRASCLKQYYPMPDAYWNNKMTLEQIFEELMVAKDATVRDYAKSHIGIIQKHLILDNFGELLQQMCRWVGESKDMQAHQLRFITHIVLFMRQIGRVEHQQAADTIITAYVEALIPRGDALQIAYYAAVLPSKSQVQLYSKFIENITESEARANALEAALQCGLDVENITRYTVETIRMRSPSKNEVNDVPQHGSISAIDRIKISALEWLTHLESQRADVVWQANAMMREYLVESKIECVRAVYLMVPTDTLAKLISIYGSKDNLPCREECSMKEFLCYKVYLAAIDSFNDWTQLYHNRPQPPHGTTNNENFTARMASEHKEQTYRAEMQRWKTTLQEQAKVTADALYNVLLFPEKGWLKDPDTSREPDEELLQQGWDHRLIQMENLRTICIPEIVLLLHKVLHQSEDYLACIKLVDELSNEHRQLYKVYPKHKLAELMAKLADSSLELLNKKLDPWGYPVTV